MAKSQAIFYGFNPPFIGGPQNILSRQEDERLIKNDLLQLLLTIPGERVHRPSFGVNLRNFVFEQLTNADTLSLENEIRVKIREFEPRVNIDTVSIIQDEDRNGLQVKIVAYLKKDPQRQLIIEQFISNPQVAR